jgi:hypothetical protein
MSIVITKPSSKNRNELFSDGYTVPETVAEKSSEEHECYKSSDGFVLCKEIPPTPGGTPPSPNPGGTPPSPNPGGTPPSPNPGGTPPSPPARQKSGRRN